MHHSTNDDTKAMLGLASTSPDADQGREEPPTWHAIHEFDDSFDMKAFVGTIDTEWAKRIFADSTKQEYQMYRHVKSYGDRGFFN